MHILRICKEDDKRESIDQLKSISNNIEDEVIKMILKKCFFKNESVRLLRKIKTNYKRRIIITECKLHRNDEVISAHDGTFQDDVTRISSAVALSDRK